MTRRKLMQRLGGAFAGLGALAAGLLARPTEVRAEGFEVVREPLPPCHDEGPTICGRYAELRGGVTTPGIFIPSVSTNTTVHIESCDPKLLADAVLRILDAQIERETGTRARRTQ